MRVLQAAILGALPAVSPRPVGHNRDLVVAAGNEVLLARKAWNPEGVNDVRRIEQDAHAPANGYVEFVGRGDDLVLPVEVCDSHHHW